MPRIFLRFSCLVRPHCVAREVEISSRPFAGSRRADVVAAQSSSPMKQPTLSRQRLLTAALASFASSPSLPAFALPNPPASIKERLDSRNSQLLLKPLNQGLATPSEAAYPDWLEGEWNAAQSFAGYELPAKDLIPREALFAEADVPGFKKCSIALLPDVGKEGVRMPLRWVRDGSGTVREDRVFNLRSSIRGGLGYDAIERIEYKEEAMLPGTSQFLGNPNRLKLVFAPGLTTNANRIEIFVNARETERPAGRDDLFYTSETIRQVTFSGTTSRQVNGEYCHFHSYRRVSPTQVDSVIVTAVYADPLQLERFFVRTGDRRPLIVFSHGVRMIKKVDAPPEDRPEEASPAAASTESPAPV